MGNEKSRVKMQGESEVKIKISDFVDSKIIKNRDKTKSFIVTVNSKNKKKTIYSIERAIKSSI
jgi:hypothetical protein